MKDFRYLDELIHSGKRHITLDSDIFLTDEDEWDYMDGIELDLDGLVIDGMGHSIDPDGLNVFLNKGRNVTIKNIEFKNSQGCAVVNQGGLTVKGCRFVNNSNLVKENSHDCPSDSSIREVYGGTSIYNEGTLTLTDSEFKENEIFNDWWDVLCGGGVIFNYNGSARLANCRLSNNRTEAKKECEVDGELKFVDWSYASAGVILNLGGKFKIAECEFIENESNGNGGVIYNRFGELKISNSSFSNNSSAGGGAICDYCGKVEIVNSRFIANGSDIGGAIFSEKSQMTIRDSCFKRNYSNDNGGAIYASESDIEIQADFYYNSAFRCGGAIYIDDCDDFITGKLIGNEAREANGIKWNDGLMGLGNDDENQLFL